MASSMKNIFCEEFCCCFVFCIKACESSPKKESTPGKSTDTELASLITSPKEMSRELKF